MPYTAYGMLTPFSEYNENTIRKLCKAQNSSIQSNDEFPTKHCRKCQWCMYANRFKIHFFYACFSHFTVGCTLLFRLQTSRKFCSHSKIPYAAFGPLFAFHCPLFVTKNNNLGWNRHASPHTGTGATFTGRRYCLRADNRRWQWRVSRCRAINGNASSPPPAKHGNEHGGVKPASVMAGQSANMVPVLRGEISNTQSRPLNGHPPSYYYPRHQLYLSLWHDSKIQKYPPL